MNPIDNGDFTHVSVAEMRNWLVENGLTEEEAKKIKGKSNLVDKIESMKLEKNKDVVTTNPETVEEADKFIEALENKVISPAEYLNKQGVDIELIKNAKIAIPNTKELLEELKEDEFDISDNGVKLPKVHGLRRLVEKYVGEIVRSTSKVVHAPLWPQVKSSTVEHRIDVLTHNDVFKTYTGASDAHAEVSATGEYQKHLTAVASTRAESIALRKLLNLNVVSSEEIVDDPTELIGDFQINALDLLCERWNVNVKSFVNGGEEKYRYVNLVPKSKFGPMMQTLNLWQTEEGKNIPEKFLGYDTEWKNDFLKERKDEE